MNFGPAFPYGSSCRWNFLEKEKSSLSSAGRQMEGVLKQGGLNIQEIIVSACSRMTVGKGFDVYKTSEATNIVFSIFSLLHQLKMECW